MSEALIIQTEHYQPPSTEVYGRSLSALREVGAIAIAGVQTPESAEIKRQAYDEFKSCVYEGLSSDGENKDRLRVANFDTMDISEGRVMVKGGKMGVVSLIEKGAKLSEQRSKEDSRMATQARRDKYDLENALVVDAMVRGETGYNTRIVVSAYPKEAVERDGIAYWEKVGYKKELNYIQLYHFDESEEKLETGALSFYGSPEKIVAVLQSVGVEVPEGIEADDIITHALTDNLTAQQAKQLALGLRDLCEEKTSDKLINTVELIAQHEPEIKKVFDAMAEPMTESLVSAQKNQATQNIVSAYLNRSHSYSPEVRGHLRRIAEKQEFTDEDGRLLYDLLVYSAIEAVRAKSTRVFYSQPRFGGSEVQPNVYVPVNDAEFYIQMANFSRIGAQAGRSYGSCGGNINLSSEISQEIYQFGSSDNNPQDVFGGKANLEETDKYGTLKFKCQNGHPNIRPRNKLIECCKTCGVNVKCDD